MTTYIYDAKNLLEEYKDLTRGRWYVNASGNEILLNHGGAATKEASKNDVMAMSDVPYMLHLIEELVKELEACHEKIETMEKQNDRTE